MFFATDPPLCATGLSGSVILADKRAIEAWTKIVKSPSGDTVPNIDGYAASPSSPPFLQARAAWSNALPHMISWETA
ncbi:hypothetical protein [Sphingobium terrigena]|nr:hypothetical protein [Sphingobium terrigena]